jgi:hypothetical protein
MTKHKHAMHNRYTTIAALAWTYPRHHGSACYTRHGSRLRRCPTESLFCLQCTVSLLSKNSGLRTQGPEPC